VARYYAKLLAIKDEYEVARLYTDGAFERSLREQFERWDGLRFHLAPPLLAKPGADGRTRKLKFGGWMWRAMALLARLRGLRGSPLDPFGYADERRMERQLVREYEALIEELLVGLSADKLELALQLARLPERVRGYGPVKHANVLAVKAQWVSTLARYRAPAEALPQEGMPA
uniref:DUF6537 domain-containing protein n=1 Tax=Pseudorhodoferax sp. TaxID=1993553 RepID=UPI002DD661E4